MKLREITAFQANGSHHKMRGLAPRSKGIFFQRQSVDAKSSIIQKKNGSNFPQQRNRRNCVVVFISSVLKKVMKMEFKF